VVRLMVEAERELREATDRVSSPSRAL